MTASELFNSSSLSDITFIVGSDRLSIPGHRFVLFTSGSEYLHTLALSAAQSEPIELLSTHADHFLPLLKFLYTNKLELPPDHAVGVLKLAVQYLLPTLRDAIIDQLCEDGLSIHNCLPAFSEVRNRRRSCVIAPGRPRDSARNNQLCPDGTS